MYMYIIYIISCTFTPAFRSRKDTAASCVASDISQASMALSKFSPPPVVYDSYNKRVEIERKIKTLRLSSDIDSDEKGQQLQVLEMKKLALLVQHLTLLFQAKPTEQERKLATELNEKDAELRNKGRSKPLKDHEKKQVGAVSSWNHNALYTLCSSKRSIIDLQKSGLQSAEFTKLQQSVAEMEVSILEATKPVSSVTTESSYLFVNRLVEKGYSQEIVDAADKRMSKSSRGEHDVKSILREKCFLAESVLESRATGNQMTGGNLVAEFNILEDKHEEANDKVVIVVGYYVDVDGNEVPRGTEDATMIIEPGTVFQYNPMSGVGEHQTSISFLHWHSGFGEDDDDDDEEEEDQDDESKQPKKPKRKRSKAEVLAKGCITALTDMDTALLHLEAGGGDMTLDQRTQMKEGLAVFDLYSFISDIKENWDIEKMLYGRIVDMSDIELMLDGIIRGEVQCLVNELNGEQSRVGVFSAEGSRQCWSILGASGSRDRITVTDMPHGQPQSQPKIMMAENLYSSGDLFDCSAGLGILHSINERLNVSSTSKSMFIIAEREEMSAEMEAERYQAMKQQLKENAKKAYKTCILKKVGLPKRYLDLCKANNIEGATIENAISLYMSWLRRCENEVCMAAINKIKSEEDAKSDDLKYLAISLEPYCDINTLDEEELTRELFTDTDAQAVFDRVLESYDNNVPLLQTMLMKATPGTASDARNWSTFTAPIVAQSKIGLNIDNVNGQVYINNVRSFGIFATTKWKNCTITFINGRRYSSFEEGKNILIAANAEGKGTVTLTVKH